MMYNLSILIVLFGLCLMSPGSFILYLSIIYILCICYVYYVDIYMYVLNIYFIMLFNIYLQIQTLIQVSNVILLILYI